MSTSTLPSHRAFVTQLLNSNPSLQQHNVSAESSPLSNAPEAVKKQLLSLQVLFPNEFLPALDLLDRRLVTRFVIGVEEPPTTSSDAPAAHNATTSACDMQPQDSEPPNVLINDIIPRPRQPTADTVHYVRSAQQRSSRFSTSYDSTVTYEVRLGAWNCTCPAFAFAAFPAVHPEPPLPALTRRSISSENQDLHDEDIGAEKRRAVEWLFGGVSLEEDMPPVCKHLLACVLAERCRGVFGEHMEEKRVSVETAAGWAAGWGDS
ncbi:hypothetical protein E8E11_009053 [Didymella keratinophila]|nr:hypothetical protein E8E11_009053 [Didymella keratinophila]